MTVPNDLTKAKVGDLDKTDTARAYAFDEFALIGFVFILGGFWLRVLGWYETGRVEEKIFWFNITRGKVSIRSR